MLSVGYKSTLDKVYQSDIMINEVKDMKLVKINNKWMGILQDSIPAEKEDTHFLGTNKIELPFSPQTTRDSIIEYFNNDTKTHKII